MPKTFIFCGQRANSKEHIFGKWPRKLYAEHLPKQARAEHEVDKRDKSGTKFIARGPFGAGYNPVYSAAKLVCQACNNVWMSKIEDQMRVTFEEIIHPVQQAILSAEAVTSIIYWSYLKSCLHEAFYPPQTVFDERQRQALTEMFGDWRHLEDIYLGRYSAAFANLYSGFKSTRLIPNDIRFFVSRCQINPRAITGLIYARKLGAALIDDQVFVARMYGNNAVPLGCEIRPELNVHPNAFVSAIFLGHFQVAVTSVYDDGNTPARDFTEQSNGIVELRLGECAELPIGLSLRPDAFERKLFKYCTDHGIAWRSSF